MNKIDIKRIGNRGVALGNNQCVSFEVSTREQSAIDGKPQASPYTPSEIFKLNDYYVLSCGKDNLEPNRVRNTIGMNRLLPELIEKQVRFLYGTGFYLYRTEVQLNKPIRVPCLLPRVVAWVDGWRENHLRDSIEIYLNKAVRDFYYMEGVWTRWRLAKSRRVGGELPIAGLEIISPVRCRFASRSQLDPGSCEDGDFQTVLVGNWDNPTRQTIQVYPRFDHSAPLTYGTAVSYARNPSFGEEVYAYNKYFRGIEQWLIGSNLTPTYINSYYENSLSAKLHVIIPYAWVERKKRWLDDVCNENAERAELNKELITVNGIEVGTEYSEATLDHYIDSEIEAFTQYLSGAKNQGKAYFSYSTPGDDGKELAWKIEEVPLKYKEFISTLIEYDKRADEVLLSSKGIDASISNISKDGIISNSGSNAFYNYMIYISTLYTAEMVVLDALQFALKLNFPEEYASGVRFGLLSLNNVQRQEDVPPGQRMNNDQR